MFTGPPDIKVQVTDQPRQRPEAPIPPESRRKHVVLSLSLPPSGRVTDTAHLVTAIFGFIDSLSQINLRPETKSKLRKVREELDKNFRTESFLQLSQAAEDKRAEKRRAEEERIAKLPAAEQKKILEKERKRAIRKTQGKTMVRK